MNFILKHHGDVNTKFGGEIPNCYHILFDINII